ncbi:hypothetical protein GDO78_022057 [Eleutherodactylus coqui]|uniref:Uncharacterized protein n=1 Tax=Eleutherodactylus coqui TaxID=57060 RepID=A0A8J6BGR2_ELECQ|nr:hypothetical protein GDO78_022057 [Eleutherodactylus coqui]
MFSSYVACIKVRFLMTLPCKSRDQPFLCTRYPYTTLSNCATMFVLISLGGSCRRYVVAHCGSSPGVPLCSGHSCSGRYI